jgi:hypothetical protein
VKLHNPSLSLLALCLTFAAIPASAQTVYSNGAINGNSDAWTINLGYIVSDTFNVANSGATITGADFGMWLFAGDTVTSAEVSITSGENGGTSYFDQTLNVTQSGCVANEYGYNICQERVAFSGPSLNGGTYWVNLQNASVPNGDPVYWDENYGPATASENTIGSIASEAFTILGTTGTSTSTTTTGTVPESSSIILFGSGILGIAGMFRRKLF